MSKNQHALPIDRESAAWLAGLLDGEGCFDDPRGNPRVRVKMSDLDVILRAADVMGANTHDESPARDGYKPLMVAQVHGDQAVAVMRAVLPWMGARRSARITEIVMAHAAKKNGRIRLLRVTPTAAAA